MEGVYQSASAREADFQKLAQNTGTNIQKILQNGKTQHIYLNELNKLSFATSKHVKQLLLYSGNFGCNWQPAELTIA